MFIAPINNGFDSEPQEGTWTSPQDLKLSVRPLEMISFASEPADEPLMDSLSDHKHTSNIRQTIKHTINSPLI